MQYYEPAIKKISGVFVRVITALDKFTNCQIYESRHHIIEA